MRYSPRTRKIIIIANTLYGAVCLGTFLPFWLMSKMPDSRFWPMIPAYIVIGGGIFLVGAIEHHALKKEAGEEKNGGLFLTPPPIKSSPEERRSAVYYVGMSLFAIVLFVLPWMVDSHLGIIEKHLIFFMAAGSLLGFVVGGGGFYWITARRMNNGQLDEPRQ